MKKKTKKVSSKQTSKKSKKNISKNRKKKVVMVSGGFDPIHIGHIRLMQEAKKLGDELVIVLNNDNWLRKKKGSEFMSAVERKEIIEALSCVDKVIISFHEESPEDMSVCEEILKVKPDIFANGGDRFADNIPEFKLCNELGIKMVFNVGKGGKVRSSSELLRKYSKNIK
jgi:rfaE bifunctional protein nucleotidyltransferase chain/domain